MIKLLKSNVYNKYNNYKSNLKISTMSKDKTVNTGIPVICEKCGGVLEKQKCESCGHVTLNDEQEVMLHEYTKDIDTNFNPAINRLRVIERDDQNVYMRTDIYKREVDKINKTIVLDSKWQHASGEVWKVTSIDETTAGITVIDLTGVLKPGTTRVLSRNVFSSLIKNNYFGTTRINRRLIGQDIASVHIRDNYIRL